MAVRLIAKSGLMPQGIGANQIIPWLDSNPAVAPFSLVLDVLARMLYNVSEYVLLRINN